QKGDTLTITLDLHKRGLSIEEIAAERKLARSTIESHLADCIADGKCEPEEFVEAVRLANIRLAAKELGTTQLTPLREHLGDSYSYSELRFALIRENRVDNNAK
ncbi:MAG TPA: helix-turn-helix domain-containing protein, partial [Bacteroidia bacterium]|nr:helix-turn-helix domain-containing protein [Bacteroidia bacterium]